MLPVYFPDLDIGIGTNNKSNGIPGGENWSLFSPSSSVSFIHIISEWALDLEVIFLAGLLPGYSITPHWGRPHLGPLTLEFERTT